MSETNKNLIKYNARVTMKHDTLAHWEQATNFVPLAGELIVYDDIHKIKIGDGTTKVNDLPFSGVESNLGEGLLIDPNTGNLRFDDLYIANYYWADSDPDVLAGRIGLMSPLQAYNIDRANMIVNDAVNYAAGGKSLGFYKFSTTSYGFIQDLEPVTAEDIEGMEINTATSGASANSGKIYIVGAEEQAATAKTFTNKKAYIDKDGYVYSNNERALTSSDVFDSFTNTIKSTLLPSYVDDIIEGYYMPFETTGAFIGTDRTTNIPGEVGKIYVDLDTNKTYRWSGNGASSRFVEISSGPLSLGTSETSAFYGNLGQIAYEHALHGEACDDKSTLDLYKIKTENGHVVGTEKVTKNDILNYKAYTGNDTISVTNGVISLNTGYYATAERAGIMQAGDFAHLWSIEANANNYVLPMATSSELGGIKVGANLTMGLDGTLSAVFPNANYETDGLMTAEYYTRLMNHTHTITYTPEATVSFSGTKGNTATGSATQVIMAILDSTATATVSSSYYNKNLTLTPAALSELGVALANHIHEFTPAGTVNYQGTKAQLTTGVGSV